MEFIPEFLAFIEDTRKKPYDSKRYGYDIGNLQFRLTEFCNDKTVVLQYEFYRHLYLPMYFSEVFRK